MLLALSPVRALADEPSSALLLSVAGPGEELVRLEAVTRELLAPLDVKLELRRVPAVDLAEMRRAAPGRYFARAWIELSEAGSARLYLEHGASDRLLVRDVPGHPSNPELLREELAHILQTAVEGLKAGEEVGEPRQQVLRQVAPEPPAVVAPRKEPSAASSPPARRAPLRFGARYEARWLGGGTRLEDGPGVVVQWARPLGLELSGSYRRPLTIDAEPVGARLQTLSPRALLTLEPWRELRLGAGVGADLVRVTPVAGVGERLSLAEAGWLALAIGRLQVSYGYRAWRFFELQLSAGVDVDLSDTRYVFQRSTGEVAVLDPATVRPFLSLGAAVP